MSHGRGVDTFQPEHLQTGRTGEDIACDFLTDQGWRIIARNWRHGHGEVDIIAASPEGVVVLVEVKARRGGGYGDPLEAITYAKLVKLREMASHWFAQQGVRGCAVRIDAIGITWSAGQPQVCHVRDIA